VRHRYPFEALRWLRHQRVDDEAAEVSASVARTAQARTVEVHAEGTRLRSEQRIAELSRAELARLDEGAVRAGDLAQVGDWRKGAESELRAQLQAELRAREALALEVAAEAQARVDLGAASSEAKLIDSHQLDWRAERAAVQERVEEEAALEQWTARRYPPRD
jgi:hypothetical protein